MPSAMYAHIAVKTSADFVVPISAPSQAEFNRKVANGFKGLVGGVLRAGDITLRPTQDPIPNHLLCDGSLLDPVMFPNLFEAIGTTFGGDGTTTFALPDYSGSLSITAPTVTQTVTETGTVSTEETVVTDAGQTGGTTGGNVTTGGRVRQHIRPDEELP